MRFVLLSLLLALNCTGQEFNGLGDLAAGRVAAATGGPEVADTFTDTDGTALASHVTTTGGYAWVAANSAFTIKANVVTNTSAGSGTTLYYVNHTMSSANYTATLDVNNISGGGSEEVSLGARYNGAAAISATAYFVTWFPDLQEARLYKVIAGSSTQLGSGLSSATCTQLYISVSGTTIIGKCNGTQVASVTDSAIATAGFVGIGPGFRGSRDSFGINVDNLSVTVP